MKTRSAIIALSAGLLTSACGHGRGAEAANGAETDSAEIAVETPIAAPPPMLPDTAMASVVGLNYHVEIVDASIPAELSTTEDLYASTPGGFTFRKGPKRDASFGGRVTGRPDTIVVDWRFVTASSENWGGGSGWSGQPVMVEWPDSCIHRFKEAGVVNSDFGPREVMVGSLCGTVYFINFDTGVASRKPIEMVNPIKGSISLDPTLNGNLYVGQGIANRRPFGAFMIDLYRHEVVHFHAEDPKAGRNWGAYDSSPARAGQFLLRPGENGTLYKFLIEPGRLKLQSALRYKIGGTAPGMEASIGIYSNYGYVADNAGTVLCVNLNTMKPVWRYDVGDDTDHSLIVEVENGHPYVYTGCEIDKQGTSGMANFVKLDGLNGKPVWRKQIEGRRADIEKKHFDGGFYATSLPGQGNCSDLIIASCVLNTRGQNGQLMAFDRKTGEIRYSTPLKYYGWSSPVGFLNDKDEFFVFAADCSGNVYLVDGLTGNILYTAHIGNNFESSPVVWGNSLVVGSRGNGIIKMSIR